MAARPQLRPRSAEERTGVQSGRRREGDQGPRVCTRSRETNTEGSVVALGAVPTACPRRGWWAIRIDSSRPGGRHPLHTHFG